MIRHFYYVIGPTFCCGIEFVGGARSHVAPYLRNLTSGMDEIAFLSYASSKKWKVELCEL